MTFSTVATKEISTRIEIPIKSSNKFKMLFWLQENFQMLEYQINDQSIMDLFFFQE
uniref:Uncharacterized protein n=1 Tax=Arion vulgaris TaxID=1028688 RepID=A0A0B7B7M3_9EUPU